MNNVFPIPGFGPGATPPTRELLATLKMHGVIQVTSFASRADYSIAVNNNYPPPINGDVPKFWGDPNPNIAPANLYLARTSDGTYVRKSVTRTDDGLELRVFSGYALSFYDSRKSIKIPAMEIRSISNEEMRRYSFPIEEIVDPLDYPIGQVYQNGPNYVQSTFPTDCLTFILDGTQAARVGLQADIPYVCRVETALKLFPVKWDVVEQSSSAGGNADQVVPMIRKLVTDGTSRLNANTILKDATLSNEQILGKLLATVK